MSEVEIDELDVAEAEDLAQRLVADLLARGYATGHRDGTIECLMTDGTTELIEWSIDYRIEHHGKIGGHS
jgi:hypothetical protein